MCGQNSYLAKLAIIRLMAKITYICGMKRRLLISILLLALHFGCGAAQRDTLRISFIGDVMMHGRQLQYARTPGADTTDAASYDFSPYFKYIRPILDSCDISVANMEFPVGVKPYSGYPVFSAPKSIVQETKESGVDLFLLANNHICDKGRRGLDSTYAIYSAADVKFTGLWRDTLDEQLNNPAIIDAGGFRVAFINFTYGLNGFTPAPPYVVGQMDSLCIKRAIERGRNRGADYIVALPHWGVEYKFEANAEQKRWRDDLYRWGVDMIVGTHPHVPQAVEYSCGRITAFSLGNYISNMSIHGGQVGLLLVATLVRREDGSIETLEPDVRYLWCGKAGLMEPNYTVVPIEEFKERPEAFLQRSQYDKMMREYGIIRQKLSQH